MDRTKRRFNMRPDPDNKLQHFFMNRLPKIIGARISCITVGKVTKYDKSKHECSVQPLPKTSDGAKRAIFNYVIVPASVWQLDKVMKKGAKKLGAKWKPMKRNSIVAVGACDRELDNFSGKKPYKITTDHMHSYNDAIVLEVIKP